MSLSAHWLTSKVCVWPSYALLARLCSHFTASLCHSAWYSRQLILQPITNQTKYSLKISLVPVLKQERSPKSISRMLLVIREFILIWSERLQTLMKKWLIRPSCSEKYLQKYLVDVVFTNISILMAFLKDSFSFSFTRTLSYKRSYNQ